MVEGKEIETEDEAMEKESKTDDPVFEMEATNKETKPMKKSWKKAQSE